MTEYSADYCEYGDRATLKEAPLTLAGPGMSPLRQIHPVDRGEDLNPADLHVIVPYYNPYRWKSRYRLHAEFMAWAHQFGASLYTVELALRDAPFQVTVPGDAHHLQMTAHGPVPWVKENLINLGIQKLLPKNAEYVAWIDGDVRFENPNWVTDTLHELQHALVVQMFSETVDVGPNCEIVRPIMHTSIIKHYLEAADPANPVAADKARVHPGYAWAARRELLAHLDPHDPLIDCSFIGSADWQMAWSFLGNHSYGINSKASPNYKRRIADFARKCNRFLRGNVAYVPGLVCHHWHGPKVFRQYAGRWDMIIKNNYDPDLDLAYRRDGLLYVTDHNPKWPLLLRAYGRSRNEDGGLIS